MNSTQLYPFERNRYYAGKMLTSSDFQTEQNYFNNKRRFINNLMFGSGIVCGCGVFSLDDLSILVESGVVIDELGREIVIDTSVVKKLSALEGFDSLNTNDVSLCIQYVEEPVHSVYAVNQKNTDSEYEYNHMLEGYKLFLIDNENIAQRFDMENEFLSSANLFENEDYRIDVVFPTTVCKGKNVKGIVKLTKISNSQNTFSYGAVLQTPNLMTSTGDYEISVDFNNVTLQLGETIEKEYWFEVQMTSAIDSAIILKSGSANAIIDGEVVSAASGFNLKILFTDNTPKELVSREIGRLSLEMKNVGSTCDYVRLAELKLVRTDSAYIIEAVRENDVKKYISVPSQDYLRSTYLDFFDKDVDVLENKNNGVKEIVRTAEKTSNDRNGVEVASGTFEIPLGDNARRGEIKYSNEIMHGLGKGNVYVNVGFEYITDDPALGVSAKQTIYGASELFADDRANVANVTTAVKVNNDKGSFIAAAKLEEDADYVILSGRWVAIRFPSGSDLTMTEDYKGKSITAETPTVVMATKESHYFGVKFNNMEPSSLEYELTEQGSGEITPDGIYTAPAKEGVYEIRIFCSDAPTICTYAYAIVKKKGFEEE